MAFVTVSAFIKYIPVELSPKLILEVAVVSTVNLLGSELVGAPSYFLVFLS